MDEPPSCLCVKRLPVQRDFFHFSLLAQLLVLAGWFVSSFSLWSLLLWSCVMQGTVLSLFSYERLTINRYRQKKRWFKPLLLVLLMTWLGFLSMALYLALSSQGYSYGQVVTQYLGVIGITLLARRMTHFNSPSPAHPSPLPTSSFPLGDKFTQEALRHIQKITVSGDSQDIAKKTTSLIELTSPKVLHSLQEECQIIEGFLSFLPQPAPSVIWRVGHGVGMEAVVPKRSMQYLLRQLLKINPKAPLPITGSIDTVSGNIIEFGFTLKTSFSEASPALNDIHAMLDRVQQAFGVHYNDVRTWCSFTSEGLSVGVCFSSPHPDRIP